MRLRLNKTIDQSNLQLINKETKKWKALLARFLDITLFLSKQNLAFRGHNEKHDSENRGNFLELVSLLSSYDVVLKEHLINLKNSSSKKISYMSPQIQNEFIIALSNHVKSNLIDEIKAAKYYGMMFDSTPDISHTDQMSEVIRYVKIENRKVEIKEVFLGFFALKGKKAIDLSEKILEKLQEDGLDIMMCRSQGYDNAATMSGVHGGVQAIIKNKNKKAIFVGCIDHSLNLCGQHSFAQNASCVKFFGTVDAIFGFFAASTSRWDILIKHSNATVKRLSTTRWSAHYNAVKVIAENFNEVIAAITELCDPQENMDTRGAAENLLPALCNFPFVCYLFFWNQVLKEVDCTQKALQTKGLSLDKVIVKMETVRLYIEENRYEIVEEALNHGKKLAEEHDISIERRVRRKKLMPGETSKDSALSLEDDIKKDMLECLDRFHSEITIRSKSNSDLASLFEAVQPNLLLSGIKSEVERSVEKLANFYDELCAPELLVEIPRFRRHISASKIDTSNLTCFNILKFIVEWDFIESVPNLVLALKLFMTICVSVASCERSFSKLKLIKNYLRATMEDSRLSSLAILSIEHSAYIPIKNMYIHTYMIFITLKEIFTFLKNNKK